MNERLMNRLRELIVGGLFVIAPLCLSIIVIKMGYNFIENSVVGDVSAWLVRALLPHAVQAHFEGGHVPGLSILLTAMLLAVLGLVASFTLGKGFLNKIDTLCLRVPVLRAIYAAARKVLNTLGESNKNRFQKVVFIEWPTPGINTLAFVTSELETPGKPKQYVLFVPHMPNPTSGFIVVIEASKVKESSMKPSEALQFGLSLGVLAPPGLIDEISQRS